MERFFYETARQIPILERCQVLVAGGGPGGLFAALAAARQGADVVLIERLGYLGGNATSGLPILGLLDDRGNVLVGGIPQEFVMRLVRIGGAVGPLPCPKHISITPVDPEAVKRIAEQMCAEAGVRVLLETWGAAPIVEGRVKGAVVESKGGRGAILADVVIDATGDADLAARAGAEFEMGEPASGRLQPPTLMFRLGGVDTERFCSYLEANPNEVYPIGRPDAIPFPMEYFRQVSRYAVVGLEEAARRAKSQGDFPADLQFVVVCLLPQSGQVAINAAKILDSDCTDPVARTAATIQARSRSWVMLRFFQRYVPGFENCTLLSTADVIGVRETRRIAGEYQLTAQDVLRGAHFEDAVCRAAYPIDIHSPDGSRSTFILLNQPYDIPYRCLVPRHLDGLLVAGRPISTSYEAFGSVRVMGTCMGIGQAAGTAAALSVQQTIEPRQIDHRCLSKELRNLGAVLDSGT